MAIQRAPLGIGQLKELLQLLELLEATGTFSGSDTLNTVESTLRTLIDAQGA